MLNGFYFENKKRPYDFSKGGAGQWSTSTANKIARELRSKKLLSSGSDGSVLTDEGRVLAQSYLAISTDKVDIIQSKISCKEERSNRTTKP